MRDLAQSFLKVLILTLHRLHLFYPWITSLEVKQTIFKLFLQTSYPDLYLSKLFLLFSFSASALLRTSQYLIIFNLF